MNVHQPLRAYKKAAKWLADLYITLFHKPWREWMISGGRRWYAGLSLTRLKMGRVINSSIFPINIVKHSFLQWYAAEIGCWWSSPLSLSLFGANFLFPTSLSSLLSPLHALLLAFPKVSAASTRGSWKLLSLLASTSEYSGFIFRTCRFLLH